MAKIQYNDQISYELFDDGYDIYYNDNPWISQRAPYNRVYKANGTNEENCLLQLATLAEDSSESEVSDSDKLDALLVNTELLVALNEMEA